MSDEPKRGKKEGWREYHARRMEWAEAEDLRVAEEAAKKRDCSHYDCTPIAWYWNGRPREMRCDECGDTNWLEETPE